MRTRSSPPRTPRSTRQNAPAVRASASQRRPEKPPRRLSRTTSRRRSRPRSDPGRRHRVDRLEADVIVVGGGPAGSAVAARLARLGRRVLLFEKERFPRFHIGESLLPCSVSLLRELGAMPALERADFLPKYAAEFVTPDGSQRQRYAFAEGLIDGAPSAFEVDRAEFDAVLLEHARTEGADVFEQHQVVKFRADLSDGVEVTVRDAAGVEVTARAEMLVDASGQSALV